MPLSESFNQGDPLLASQLNAITAYINAMATRNSLAAVTTASAAVGASSTAENTVSPTWVGSTDIGSSKLAAAGANAKIRIGFNYRLEAGQMVIRAYVGGNLIVRCRQSLLTTGHTKAGFFEVDCLARVAGASGKLVPRGFYVIGHPGDSTAVAGSHGNNTSGDAISEISLDLTAAQAITLSCEFTSSHADNSFIVDQGTIQIVPSPSSL
jgi:hypothetical protein